MDHNIPENFALAEKFFDDRSELISRENDQRSDHEFRKYLSPTAKKACEIVSQIRLEEHRSIWSRSTTHAAEDPTLESEELFPGMIFNSAKNHMESTKLWKIVQRMPKGSLLHCHLGAMVDLEWLFDQALQTSGMVISASVALTDADTREKATVKIEFSKGFEADGPSIWWGRYHPHTKVPLKAAAETFPDGGKPGFLKWMKDRCSVTQSEAVQNHLGVDDIWRKLQSAFVIITPVAFYEPITRKLLRRFLRTAYEDGVKWIEFRGMTRSFRLEGETELVENRLELVRVLKEEIDRFVNAPAINLGDFHALENELHAVVNSIVNENNRDVAPEFKDLAARILGYSEPLGKAVDDTVARGVEATIYAELMDLRPRYARHMVLNVADSETIKTAKELIQRVFDILAPEVVPPPVVDGRKKGFWGCRLIWDTLRSFDDEAIIQDMKLCMQAKTLYPTFMSGYDLVGPEDLGRTLHSLSPILLWFQRQCTLHSLTLPFFLHAGETLGSGTSTDDNLYDALLLKSRRIGHAFSLYKHPLLIDMMKEKQVLVECCPISNEVLRYTASIKMHPLPALLARGVKASLSNDDPSMMGQGSAGLSHDFWQALQGWDNLGLAGLGSLAQNSVRWSAFEDQDDNEWFKDVSKGEEGAGLRASRIKEWNAEWEEFCHWIVDEFGEARQVE